MFTVADKINYIKDTLITRESCSFFELFSEYVTATEIITTFQAVLELLKLQTVKVLQQGTFGSIVITANEG